MEHFLSVHKTYAEFFLSDNQITYGKQRKYSKTTAKHKLNKLEKYGNTFGTTSTKNLPTPTFFATKTTGNIEMYKSSAETKCNALLFVTHTFHYKVNYKFSYMKIHKIVSIKSIKLL